MEAQTVYAFRTGVSFSAGNVSQRLGLFCQVQYSCGVGQCGFRYDWYAVRKAWGHARSGSEMQLTTMIGAGFGKRQDKTVQLIDFFSSIVGRECFTGYSYIWYWDDYFTSQRTGAFAFQSGYFRLIFENDFLGALHSDKWRTAGVLLAYETDSVELGLKLVLWTADGFHSRTHFIKDSDYPARFGYRDLSTAPFGRCSIGALGLQVRKELAYDQVASVYGGVDAEQIRNAFQNKFMHDMWFLPKKMIGYPMPNYPMVTENGKTYLYNGDSGNIRKPRPFIQTDLNAPLFY